ncbi:MAG: hypothetical protein ACOYL3_00440 [Desulfuromonadaceae bacterium]
MMVKKLTMVLLAGALALPVAGFAVEQAADAPKAAVAAPKPVIVTPADCVVTGKNSTKTSDKAKAEVVTEKRKQIHARKGLKSGEEKLVVHDHEAAREHGRHGEHN